MYNIIKENILENNLINQGDNVLVGLSGGPDSVFLVHNLRLLKETLSFNLYASHINHLYRGWDAEQDEAFVRELCNKYNIKLFVKRKNTTDYSKELRITEEEAGRILRYNFYRENLKEIGGGLIAVAHNLNDQAETVLQRIIRGTGIDGLKAMTFKNNDIIRPILNINKEEILKFLNDNNFKYCIDKTNAQDIYGRNKIRLNLIPYLENNFNPNIQNILVRMSESMYNDSKIIEKYVKSIFRDVLIKKTQMQVVFDLYKLKKLEDYETRRVIRYAIGCLKGDTNNIEMKHLDYVNEFIKTGTTGKAIDLSEGFMVNISYNDLIVRKSIEKIENFKYNIKINEPLYIKETGKVVLCKVMDTVNLNAKADKNTVNIDYESVNGNLTVRNRRNGDKIIPIGMTGTKKLKDVFIDMKVPAGERDKKLIIADDDNILWVEDFRIHNNYKISSLTRKILNITITEA